MNVLSHVPPGFRFHPTDEELVDFYLRRKVASRRFDVDVIKEVDLYKIEPWDLQELCKIGTEEQSDWYFFSHKDKKYPTGTRTNRATTAGFWKATGRDKAIYSKHDLIGMRKTLVFYKGRAPNGQKSDWIMHEYRLETDENGTPQEEGWVVCRVFKKKLATNNIRRFSEHDSPCWYDDQASFMPDLESPKQNNPNNVSYQIPYPCKKELDQLIMPYHQQLSTHHHHHHHNHHDQNFLPLLESPKLLQSVIAATSSSSTSPIPALHNTLLLNNSHSATTLHPVAPRFVRQDQERYSHDENNNVCHVFDHGNNSRSNDHDHEQAAMMDGRDQLTDWRVLDKFVASQLSHEDGGSKEMNSFSNPHSTNINILGHHWEKQQMVENASTSNYSDCQIDHHYGSDTI